MKKILFGFSLMAFMALPAQSFPDYYPNNSEQIYGSEEDAYYFPDDYYYDYPEDYYTEDLYQSYYNDYRRSIRNVNWDRFISKYRLSPWQVQQIMILNDSFPSFAVWNTYYRHNPDRWYYDRFYALERILGPQVFVIFQNRYYNGYNPVIYFQNYRRQHYVTNVYVIPRYRNVNIVRYRVDRVKYHQSVPQHQFGFNNSPRSGGSWSQNNGFNNGGIRKNGSNDNGFRFESAPKTLRNQNNTPRTSNVPSQENAPRSGGFRNSDSGSSLRNSPGKNERTSDGNRKGTSLSNSSGLRFTRN